MSENVQVPYLLKDAVVSIDFHSDFVNHLQQTLNYIADGKEEDDFTALKEHLEQGIPLSGWEHAFYVLTSLLKGIHDKALQEGKVVYKSTDSNS